MVFSPERKYPMIGVINRLPHVVCEVGDCYVEAACTEYITVIPSDPVLQDERREIDIVLCRCHDARFEQNGLVGTITAHGDQVVERAA
jgi:hypothetical protein